MMDKEFKPHESGAGKVDQGCQTLGTMMKVKVTVRETLIEQESESDSDSEQSVIHEDNLCS